MRRLILLGIVVVMVVVLGSAHAPNTHAQSSPAADWQPVIAAIEASPIRDVTVVIGNADGEQFRYTKGDFADDEPYLIASASKWYTAALAMQLVEAGQLDLAAHPQAYLPDWPTDPSDPLSQITVEQMLAFTTGFAGNANAVECTSDAEISNEECLDIIVADNFVYPPGTTFYYGPAHMHLLGVIIEAITGVSYQRAFRTYIADPLALSPQTAFILSGMENPRAAGGAASTVNDYFRFLSALFNGEILADSYATMLDRHTPDGTDFAYRPPSSIGDRAWQYALGAWLTCDDEVWTDACAADHLVTSPGAFGWTPYIDPFDGHYGLIAQMGGIAARPAQQSVQLLETIAPLIDAALAG